MQFAHLAAPALALMLMLPTEGRAEITVPMKIGNWSGGVWVDPTSKQFGNCGVGLKFSGGTQITALVNAAFEAVFVVSDPRITTQPGQRISAQTRLDQNPVQETAATGLTPNMVRLPMPAFPNGFDMVRKAKLYAFAVPGLQTSLDISGIGEVLPALIECTVRERARMAGLPPSAPQATPADLREAGAFGIAAAVKSGVPLSVVFPDGQRPPNMGLEKAISTWGHAGFPGPGGPANVIGYTHWYPPAGATSAAQLLDARQAAMRQACKASNFQTGAIQDAALKPGWAAIFSVCSEAYEEVHLVPRANGGFREVSLMVRLDGRKVGEQVGQRYRAAFGQLLP